MKLSPAHSRTIDEISSACALLTGNKHDIDVNSVYFRCLSARRYNFTAIEKKLCIIVRKIVFKFSANVSFSAENLSSPSFLATLSRLHLQIFVVSSFDLAPDR